MSFLPSLFLLFACFTHRTGASKAESARPGPATAMKVQLASGLFDSDELLTIGIRGNLKELINDRSETPSDHDMELSCMEAGKELVLPVKMCTRGHFRKTMGDCTYPPLLIQFTRSDALSASLFHDQRKMKLVVPCSGDQYVVKEWLAYKIYGLITPLSFRVRLVRVMLTDTRTGKDAVPFYGMLLEEEDQMARRNGLMAVSRNIQPEKCEKGPFLDLAVFEYLIGNTDWSVQYGQNIKLLGRDSLSVPTAVPYDFDQSGLVNAPYGKPAEELELSNVQVRRYRGYCVQDPAAFDSSFAKFIGIRPQVNALVGAQAILSEKDRSQLLKFIDGFYTTIGDPKKRQREFAYPCDPRNPGVNVVIKGLQQ